MDATQRKAILKKSRDILQRAAKHALKHDGPGPHDNGSPQEVHAGDGGRHSEAQMKKMLEKRVEVEKRIEQIKQDVINNPTRYENKTDQEILDIRQTFYNKTHRMEQHGLDKLTPTELELYNKDMERWNRLGLEMARRRELYSRERQLKQVNQSIETGIITVEESEMRQLIGNPGDAYRDVGYAGEYNPDIMRISDLSGMRIRYYVTLPDGRIAHPDELIEAKRRGRVIVVEDAMLRNTK